MNIKNTIERLNKQLKKDKPDGIAFSGHTYTEGYRDGLVDAQQEIERIEKEWDDISNEIGEKLQASQQETVDVNNHWEEKEKQWEFDREQMGKTIDLLHLRNTHTP